MATASTGPQYSHLNTNEDNDEDDAYTADQRSGAPAEALLESPSFVDDEDPLNLSSPAPSEQTRSWWYLLVMTASIGGLQIAWSVELSSISPFLLSLGIPKSWLALVWIAGPLSGVIVQPYVGLRSDNCTSRFGRRRPFIVWGGAATLASLLLLSWTRELISGALSIFGASPKSAGVVLTEQVFAVLLVYVLDFAINVVQAGIRAFIVDCAPTHQQEDANALANVLTGVGNIIGYYAGEADLPHALPFLGRTQFQCLCAITTIVFAATIAISCASTTERVNTEPDPAAAGAGVLSFCRSFAKSVSRLSPQVRRVCVVQLWAWMGWFPFLFYISTYVGEIYVSPRLEESPDLTPEQVEKLWEDGTRRGSHALLLFAITSLISSAVAPLLTVPTYTAPQSSESSPMSRLSGVSGRSRSPRRSSVEAKAQPASRTGRLLQALPLQYVSLKALQIPSFTLRRCWLLSHIVFALLMWATFFVYSVGAATALVAAIGIPWGITNWAPFALIANDISARDAYRRGVRSRARPRRNRNREADGNSLGESMAGDSVDEESLSSDDGYTDQAGVVLGIHNVAVSAPQAVATLVCSLIFKALQKPRDEPNDSSVAWTLRFGGICSVAAALATVRVKERGSG